MPDLATLLPFRATALPLVASPGPKHVGIVARSIDRGRRAGVASALVVGRRRAA